MVCEDFFEMPEEGDNVSSIYTCRDKFRGSELFENPGNGLISFDNVAISMLNLFQVGTLLSDHERNHVGRD